jgi:hypothetical protein
MNFQAGLRDDDWILRLRQPVVGTGCRGRNVLGYKRIAR